jgi:hypothetical protein
MKGFPPVPVVNRLGRGQHVTRAIAMWTGLLVALGALPEGIATARSAEAAAPTSLVSAMPMAPVPGSVCDVFPANNIWNTSVKGLPVHRKSRIWKRSMKAWSSRIHPAFGRAPYGMPFKVVGISHPQVRVKFDWPSESDTGTYPFGSDIPLERNEDRHALMINKDTCTLFELYRAALGPPRAGSGAIFNLKSNWLRPNGWTSADAAGLPIFAGLLQYDEVMSGYISHAIRFTVPRTDCRHVWPARHHVGGCNRRYPPMGARLRLRLKYNISRFSGPVRTILRAMKRFGLILADNGPGWYIGGTMDSRWTSSILRELKTVPARQFQVVNQSLCKISSKSAAANCP